MPTHRPPASRTLSFAVVAVAIVVAYGSLFPFDFDGARWGSAWSSGAVLTWAAPSRSDLIANLLLYVPLGALLMRVLAATRTGRGAAVLTVLLGTLMSLAIEVLQNLVPERTPSLVDLLLNAASTALGALATVVWLAHDRSARDSRLGLDRWLRTPRDPVALLAIGLWIAAHTAPFVPHADLRSAWHALAPLREFALTPHGLLKYTAGFLVLASVARATLHRERFWSGFLALTLACITCRVLFVRQDLGPNEPLALALTLPLIALLRQVPNSRTARTVLAWAGFAWLAYGVVPFETRAVATAFEWRPFAGFLTGDAEAGYVALLEKASFYTAWAWLAAYGRVPRAALLVVGTIAIWGVEMAQCHLAGRTGDVTEPLLFLLIATVVTSLGPRATSRGNVPRRRRTPGSSATAGEQPDGQPPALTSRST